MRFDNFITEDTKGFYNSMVQLNRYESQRIKNILESSWIKLRESLSSNEQTMLVHVINESYGTDYENIYYIPTQLESLPHNWKTQIKDIPKVWSKLNESLGDSVVLSYGLIWAKLVSEV